MVVMKTLITISILMLMNIQTFAEDKWIIEGSRDDVRMKQQYDYDYTHQYKGEIDDDGYTRLRNPYTGDTLRGNIDEDGYGRLRDSEGNTWRVKPK